MKCKYCNKFQREKKKTESLFLHFLRFQLLHALFSFAVPLLLPTPQGWKNDSSVLHCDIMGAG